MFEYFCDTCWTILPSESNRTIHFNSKTHKNCVEFVENFERVKIASRKYACWLCSKWCDTENQLALHNDSPAHRDKLATKSFILAKLLETNSSPTDVSTVRMANTWKTNDTCTDKATIKPIAKSMSENQFGLLQEKNRIGNSMTLHAIVGGDTESGEWCHTCYLKYTSDTHRQQHLSGAQHAKRIQNLKEMDMKSINEQLYCSVCNLQCNSMDVMNIHTNSDKHLKTFKQYEEYCLQNRQNIKMSALSKVEVESLQESYTNIVDTFDKLSISTSSQSIYNTPLSSPDLPKPNNLTCSDSSDSIGSHNSMSIDEDKISSSKMKTSSTFNGYIEHPADFHGHTKSMSYTGGLYELANYEETESKSNLGQFIRVSLTEELRNYEKNVSCFHYVDHSTHKPLETVESIDLYNDKWKEIFERFKSVEQGLNEKIDLV
jgi:hypothetical protein